MKLSELTRKNKRNSKRLGRGRGSGKGKTSTRGHKGQKSRSGHNIPKRFEGGQTSLIQKLPKQGGFKSKTVKPVAISLDIINIKFNNGEKVNPKSLYERKIIKDKNTPFKILSGKELTKKLTFEKCKMSKNAMKICGK